MDNAIRKLFYQRFSLIRNIARNARTSRHGNVLLVVLFLSCIAILFIVLLQTRLAISIYRQGSETDAVTSAYDVETEVMDYYQRVVAYHIPLPPDSQFTLPSGTKLTVNTSNDLVHKVRTVSVTGKRPLAATRLIWKDTKGAIIGVDHIDLVLALDCTTSMDTLDAGDGGSRFQSLKAATLNFLDAIIAHPNSSLFHVGVSIFRVDERWLKTPGGVPISPDSGLTATEIRAAVDSAFQTTTDLSPQCLSLVDGTDIGAAFIPTYDFW